MDLIAQINRIKHRLNEQARIINASVSEAEEIREAIKHLTALEENNAAMIAEMMAGLKKTGALVVDEKIGLTVIDGGKNEN